MEPRVVDDLSPAMWLEKALTTFDGDVRSHVPPVFDAYARVPHPVLTASDTLVTWADVAARTGRPLTPATAFEELAGRAEDSPWDGPAGGTTPPEVLVPLLGILARHTGTPERCWFCLWEGYPPWNDARADRPGGMVPAIGPARLGGPRVRLPHRDYFLATGPLASAAGFGDHRYGAFSPQSPNLTWPDDRAWCCAVDTDLDSTYVGGTEALIAELLASPELEVLRVTPDTPLA
ncbi:hypothetical protein ACSNOI_08135 [Actinomadura kijaniata]|uniref:hypothetical protein n=1 Tax=Actinomadura kijaniata TaxID=46161 RepID=UPI003F1AC38E